MVTTNVDVASRFEAEADAAAQRRDLVVAIAALNRAVAADPSSFGRWMKLVALCRATGDHGGADAALSRALALQPLDFTALLLRAAAVEREDASPDAIGEAYRRALAQRPRGGVPASGSMGAMIVHAEQIVAGYVARQDERIRAAATAALRPGVADPAGADPAVAARIDRFRTNILRQTRSHAPAPTLFDYPGLRNLEFMDRADLPFLTRIEAATAAIEAEFDAIFKAEVRARIPYIDYRNDAPLAQWAQLNRSDRWSAIHLIRNGQVLEAARRHCPETLRLFASTDQPHIPGMSPNLMFSLLAPRTRIPPHTGVSNTRIVFHLPLIVPPACGFRVGDEMREWRRGEAFAFDDTIEHEAWNDSDELRVIVIADMWRPELSAEERVLASAMMVAAGIGGGQI